MVQLLKEGHIHLCRQRVDKDLLHIGRMRSYDLSRAQRNDKGGAVRKLGDPCVLLWDPDAPGAGLGLC